MSAEVTAYVQQHEAVIAPLLKDYSLKVWNLSLEGTNQKFEEAVVEAKERYLKVYNNREEFEQLKRWKAAGLRLDELTARQFKLIYDGFVPNQIEPDVLRDIVQRETQIENLFNTFRPNFEGDKASDNQLRQILRTEQNPSRLSCGQADAAFLPTFRVQPILGRNFTHEEDLPNGPRVVLLSYGFWRSRFAGDPRIVGKSLSVDGKSTLIVGVLPADFEMPTLARADRRRRSTECPRNCSPEKSSAALRDTFCAKHSLRRKSLRR